MSKFSSCFVVSRENAEPANPEGSVFHSAMTIGDNEFDVIVDKYFDRSYRSYTRTARMTLVIDSNLLSFP